MKISNHITKVLAVLTLVFTALASYGQEAEAAAEPAFQITFTTLIYFFSFLLLMIAISIWMIARHLKRYMKKEFKETKPHVERNFWERFLQIKSRSTDKDTMIDHPHDGIYELDNPAPPWFMFLFYGTIVFAVVYYVRFTFTDWGYTQAEEYEQEMLMAEAGQDVRLAKAGSSVDENTVVYLVDDESLAKGKAIYDGNCKICHGDYGQGAVGPNFTDDYFIHGGSIKDIFKLIKYGVVEKGMISWQSQLSADAMQKVASYVKNLQGTTPPVPGKEAQGELYVETEEDSAVDGEPTGGETE